MSNFIFVERTSAKSVCSFVLSSFFHFHFSLLSSSFGTSRNEIGEKEITSLMQIKRKSKNPVTRTAVTTFDGTKEDSFNNREPLPYKFEDHCRLSMNIKYTSYLD